MADEPADEHATLDELEWRRQRAVLHGEWDEAARYAELAGARMATAPSGAAPGAALCCPRRRSMSD